MLLSLKAKICARCINCVSGCLCTKSGDTMIYTRQHLIPYLMQQGDLDTACGLGCRWGISQFLRKSNRLTASCCGTDAYQCGKFLKRMPGKLNCSTCVGKAQISEATDARITQQLAHAAAALYTAYQRMRLMFGVEGTECPDLSSDEDQLLWLLGHIAAFKRCNTMAQVRTVEVPQDIPVKVRAMSCLDDKKWWGMPKAAQAAVWIIVPAMNTRMLRANG